MVNGTAYMYTGSSTIAEELGCIYVVPFTMAIVDRVLVCYSMRTIMSRLLKPDLTLFQNSLFVLDGVDFAVGCFLGGLCFV
jgi:hypothetical protein